MYQESAVAGAFKECASCGTTWTDLNDFLEDPAIRVVGYQAHFEILEAGLLLFNHNCGNTLALYLTQVAGLYGGMIFRRCRRDAGSAPEFCLYDEVLRPCPVLCECAFVDEILRIISLWPKREEQFV